MTRWTRGVAVATAASTFCVAQLAAQSGEAPKEKTRFNIYGFVQSDAGYDFGRIDPRYFDRLRPSALPSDTAQFGKNGQTFFSVRQSRLGLKTYAPSDVGEIFTVTEFDLVGSGADAGKTTPRLRHAYGSVRWFGAGQYWSPFIDLDAYPTTFESFGPSGLPWVRNIQVRWMPLRDQTKVTLAVEKPGASGEGGDFSRLILVQEGVLIRFKTPEWVASVRRDWKAGHVQLAGLYRRVWWDDLVADTINLAGNAAGWGGSLTGAYKFGEKNIVRLQYLNGVGIENYVNDGTADIGPVSNPDPHRPVVGKAMQVQSFSAYAEYYVGKWGAIGGGSAFDPDNTDAQSASAFGRGSYGSFTLLYNPAKNLLAAAEYQYGRRKNFRDGFGFSDNRLQFSFRYSFSAEFHAQ